MKIGILFTVRISSSRLPGKALLEVREIPMIEYLINRFKALCSEKLVICTTDLPADDCFDAVAARLGVDIFHGDPSNILCRHLQCAEHFGFDYVINVDCDDVFSSPELVKQLVAKMPEYDVIYTTGHPFGTNIFAYSVGALRSIQTNEKQVDTGWGALIKDNPSLTRYAIEASPNEQYNIRLSMDYEEDFALFKHIIEALDMDKKIVSQAEIINYIKCNPDVAKINEKVS
jgi:spore coat polysaccharide biosynthesis protein SpsF